MPKRIFIGGLSVATTTPTLTSQFAPYGTIVRAVVNVDANGTPQGTATVEYTTDQAGTAAISAKDGAVIDGSTVSVTAAR